MNKEKEHHIEIYELTIRTQFEQINELCEQIDELQDRINRVIEELKLWQPEIEALKMEKNYLLDILEGKYETNN